MVHPVTIENICALRREAGIEDVELGEAIHDLQAGDHVKLTLVSSNKSAARETVLVRITSIAGHKFRGKLVNRPIAPDLSALWPRALLNFMDNHIHSIAKPPRKLETHGKRN